MSKVATKPKTFTAVDSYNFYSEKLLKENLDLKGVRAYGRKYGKILKEDNTIYIDYPTYKKILALYFIKAGIKLIHGYTLDLLHQLGCLFILRIGRNPANLTLNRVESFRRRKELKAQGRVDIKPEEWRTYYTDDEYVRLKWFKPSFVRNIKFYTFAPAGGQPGKGFKQLMSRSISSNRSLLSLYPFVPYN